MHYLFSFCCSIIEQRRGPHDYSQSAHFSAMQVELVTWLDSSQSQVTENHMQFTGRALEQTDGYGYLPVPASSNVKVKAEIEAAILDHMMEHGRAISLSPSVINIEILYLDHQIREKQVSIFFTTSLAF